MFDRSTSSFIKDDIQLEPASEDEMTEFDESDKIKKVMDMKKDNTIDKDDVFDTVPSKDLRDAHNENTLDQHLEKIFNTSSPLDRYEIMTIIPGLGDNFNEKRAGLDLREEHLEFMEKMNTEKYYNIQKKLCKAMVKRQKK